MTKIGKRYKRTDELNSSTRSSLGSNTLVAAYDPDVEEEFKIPESEFASVNPTENVVPVMQNGQFIDSPLTVVYDNGTATDIVSGVPMTIPSGTLSLGGLLLEDGTIQRGVTELKDAGFTFIDLDKSIIKEIEI